MTKEVAGFLVAADRQQRFREPQSDCGAIGVVVGSFGGASEGEQSGVPVARQKPPGAQVGPTRFGGVERLGACEASVGVERELVGQ